MLKNTICKDEKNCFVYGSLMEGFYNYDKYLKGKHSNIKKAKIKGKLFDMPHKGYPAILKGNDTIYGELVELKDFLGEIDALDEMENYFGDNNPKNEYNRVTVTAELEDGSTEEAYMYLYALNDPEVFEKEAVYVPYGDWRKYKETLND